MRVAVLTMIHNEKRLLPLWINYYGNQVGVENIFIIDHGSTDGSTMTLRRNIMRIPHGEYDVEKRSAFISDFHSSLLYSYDWVIFCDVDEFLVPEPDRFSGLKDLIASFEHDVNAGIGLNVLHACKQEQAIDWQKPILSQRKFVQFSGYYCKPLIARRKVNWHAGFHSCQGQYALTTKFYLLHLKSIDLDFAKSQLSERQKVKISSRDAALKRSVQFNFDNRRLVSEYFPLANESLLSDFKPFSDFSSELKKIRTIGLGDEKSSLGGIYLIPERFVHPPVF